MIIGFQGLPMLLVAQTLVGTAPTQRTAVLEEFTAIHCGNCPAGHADAATLQAMHGDELVIVELHAGGLAVPAPGEPDLRNIWATELHDHNGISATPKGLVNRLAYGGQTVLNRTAWSGAVDAVLAMPSPVNIGLASSFDPGTRTLTVNVELYYTSDGAPGEDRITVLLKEDHIIGWQTDYGPDGDHPDYDHVDVLRAMLADTWGDPVTNPVAGTLVSRTYQYTVPVEWNIANCATVAFVGEFQDQIYQAREVAADGGSTVGLQGPSAYLDGGGILGLPHPIPADAQVIVPLIDLDTDARFCVLDALGKEVSQQIVPKGVAHVSIDVHALPAGVYRCQLTTATGSRSSRTLMVQH